MEEQTVDNQVAQAPAPVSKKPNHWIIAGIILVLLLIFSTIYVRSLPSRKPISPPPKPLASPFPISPTPTPIVIPTTEPSITANWKTYSSSNGYSIRYPSSMQARTPDGYPYDLQLENSDLLVTFIASGLPEDKKILDAITYGFCLAKKDEIRQEIINQLIVYRSEKTFNEKNICLDAAIGLNKRTFNGHETSHWIIDIQAKAYNQTGINLYNQILSTFKFLDTQEDKEQLGDAASKEECLVKGGVWQKWGLAQLEYCQIPAKDAGKSCTDQSQCTYGCVSETGTVPGKCATYKNTFGCFSIVDNGRAEQALCVD